MKNRTMIAVLLFIILVLSGCGQSGDTTSPTPGSTPNIISPDTPDPALGDAGTAPDTSAISKRDTIPFDAGQLYAAAYLGYQTIEGLDYYADRYLDSAELPIHYVSDGDYYLVIPRYDSTSLSLYVNDIETSLSTLRFFDPDCGPFIIQCNTSDIFTDITARLGYNGETAEFSPFISLKDGELMIGEGGLDLTRSDTAQSDANTTP